MHNVDPAGKSKPNSKLLDFDVYLSECFQICILIVIPQYLLWPRASAPALAESYMPTIHQTIRHFHSADLLALCSPKTGYPVGWVIQWGGTMVLSLQLGSVPCSGAPLSVGPAGGTFSGYGTSPQPPSCHLTSHTTRSYSSDPTSVCWLGSQNGRAPGH